MLKTSVAAPFTLVLSLIFMSSCGLINFKENLAARGIATSAIEKLVTDEETSFQAEIEHKLFSLHCYYLIAQKNLIKLEDKIPSDNLSEIYMSSEYLSLIATKGQIDEIEAELLDVYEELSQMKNTNHSQRKKLFVNEIEKFSKRSVIASQSLINLINFLGLSLDQSDMNISKDNVFDEISNFDKDHEFNIYERNIDHLSYMMEMNLKSEAKKWAPSENDSGNLTGEEFPSKLWSLTFSLGPKANVTSEILNQLKLKNSKATFFIAAKNLNKLDHLKMARNPMVELGVQSMSNTDLTKVGYSTLEKEITEAKMLAEKSLKKKMNFYRLPLGAGQRVPQIRELIAKNQLIHILWNVDSLDWIPQTSERILKRTKFLMLKSKKDSGIILFHDLYPRTIAASNDMISYLSQNSRRMCHLKDILAELNSNGKEICK
jgi:peptidoglycan/xylan/chitin deacetylase (PgdA/CDA1 family)